jgi:hypothetical protein
LQSVRSAFSPATADTVIAAREGVAAAERTRVAECAKRGPNCRARETDEGAARTALAKAVSDKAATDRAEKLDADAAVVRARLAKAAPVASAADPAAAALASYLRLFGVAIPAPILSEWLVLVGVIALELGSALSIVLVRSVSGGPRWALSTGGVPQDAAATKIVDTLREQGGRARSGSVRRLGQAIGECKSTTWNALAALIAGGVIERVGSELVLRS